MRPDELERQLRQRLDALGPAPRAELLHVLMLPDFERADRIGEFWSHPQSHAQTQREAAGGWPSVVSAFERRSEPVINPTRPVAMPTTTVPKGTRMITPRTASRRSSSAKSWSRFSA